MGSCLILRAYLQEVKEADMKPSDELGALFGELSWEDRSPQQGCQCGPGVSSNLWLSDLHDNTVTMTMNGDVTVYIGELTSLEWCNGWSSPPCISIVHKRLDLSTLQQGKMQLWIVSKPERAKLGFKQIVLSHKHRLKKACGVYIYQSSAGCTCSTVTSSAAACLRGRIK